LGVSGEEVLERVAEFSKLPDLHAMRAEVVKEGRNRLLA